MHVTRNWLDTRACKLMMLIQMKMARVSLRNPARPYAISAPAKVFKITNGEPASQASQNKNLKDGDGCSQEVILKAAQCIAAEAAGSWACTCC